MLQYEVYLKNYLKEVDQVVTVMWCRLFAQAWQAYNCAFGYHGLAISPHP